MTYDIFISYKRRDTSSAIAALVYNYLSQKGYKVFFDRKEIRQGRFNEQLYNHIEGAKDIIILLEETSLRACFSEITDAYKTDWFCKEVMYALELEKDKHIIPILIGGYIMPEPEHLPEELKSLPLQNAISLDASEMDEVFQKYFINQGYLLSKPKGMLHGSNLANNEGNGISDFLFYTSNDCDIYECGEKLFSLSSENDEEHPYRYGVKRSGEHRFHCINNDTCEELKIVESIETGGQKYIELKWTKTQNLWALTDKDIENQEDDKILFDWGNGLFWGTTTHQPDTNRAFLCLSKAASIGNDNAIELFVNKYVALFDRDIPSEYILPWLEKASEFGSTTAKLSIAKFYVGINDKKSVDICTEAAEAGDTNAMYHLARIYLCGEQNVSINPELSEYWFNKAIECGSIKAMCKLAQIYERGDILPKNDVKAAQLYQLAVESGSKTALTMLGNCYREGIGVEQNKNKAVELYKQAVESGNMEEVDPWSQYIMGLCFSSGTGVEKDDNKALEWFYKAARNGDGNIDSMFQIGFYHFNGIATEQNYKQAYDWFKKASENGDSDSYLFLGYMYNDGLYVEADKNIALDCFLKAAEAGITLAMKEVGLWYYNNKQKEENIKIAIDWFRKAAELGDGTSQRMMAFAYTNFCQEEEIDLETALLWLERSAEQNDVISLYILGDIYSHTWNLFKNNIPFDMERAFNYYLKSAECGYPKAQYVLGNLYEYQDVPNFEPNFDKAFYWYQKAADSEYVPAYYSISQLYEDMRYAQHSEEKSLVWAAKAIENGYIRPARSYNYDKDAIPPEQIIDALVTASQKGYKEAKNCLANFYLSGKVHCEDPKMAIDIYTEASSEGDLQSRYQLALLYLQKHYPLHKYYVNQNVGKAKELMESLIMSYEENPYYDNGALPNCVTGAYYNLGLLYKKGKTVPLNLDKAQYFFIKASQNGTHEALEEIISTMKAKGKNIVDFYKTLSNRELLTYALSCFREACEEMSRRYKEGDGCEQNDDKARYWLNKADSKIPRKTVKLRFLKFIGKQTILYSGPKLCEPQKWIWQK